jgi:cell division protein FtsB
MPALTRRPASLVNGMFVLTLGLLAYLGAIGFGTVWVRHQISVTANINRALEQQITDLQRAVNETSAEIAYALNPEQLILKNTTFGLHLVRPAEQQVFRITDDVERRLSAKRFSHVYTAQEGRGGEATP